MLPLKTRIKQAVAVLRKGLSPPSGRWFTIYDQQPGYWQQDTSIALDSVLTFSAVFACIRQISTDIGKLGLRLMQSRDGIKYETDSKVFSAVIKKPHPYMTRVKFYEYWLTSKLIFGNTYVLKTRDSRGIVTRLRILDPTRVTTLISDSGDVFYRLRTDNFGGVPTEITVPATEIIHDTDFTPEHPLIGVSRIAACGVAAQQGLNIQTNSKNFFGNMSRPSGMLTAPGAISDDTATRLKTTFETNFGGDNIGKLLVAGDGLDFKAFTIPAEDAQLIQQLEWTALTVCSAYGVPPYKVGIGQMPTYDNINALNQEYYGNTIQELIECIEILLDEGLELPEGFSTEFDVDDLLRMDSKAMSEVLGNQVKAGQGRSAGA